MILGIIISSFIVLFVIIIKLSPQKYINLDSEEFNNKSKGKYIIDVRTTGEYKQGHIEKAVKISYSNLENKLSTIDKDTELFVYCQSGGRSRQACNKLVNLGFTNVYNLRGGLLSWKHKLSR